VEAGTETSVSESRTEHEKIRNGAVTALAIVAAVYVLVFLVLLADEMLLKTYFLDKHLPDGMKSFLQFIYWPIIQIFKALN
jgi:uncharacterized membrane protein